MSLSRADRLWLTKTVRRILAEVIKQEAQHGGYDGATEVIEDEEPEGKRRKRRIGFKP